MMTKGVRYTEEFKRNAVFQVMDRGYLVKEVPVRLGISTKPFCDWIKQFKNLKSVRVIKSDEARENRQIKK
jgi:transposase